MFQTKRIIWCGTIACLLNLLAGPVLADPKPKDSLAQYVPEDVWLYSYSWRTPDRDRIFAHWDEVMGALKTCGIDQEIRRAIYTTIPDEKKPTFDQKWDEVTTAFGAVEWIDLVCDDIVFAERLKSVVPDLIVIARPKPDTLQENVKALAGIFDLFNSYVTGKPVPAKIHGRLRIWSIESNQRDIGLHFLHLDDKIALVFGQSALADVRSLMLGEKKIASFQNNAKFKRAAKEVPAGGFSITFLDVDAVFKWVSKLPALILGKHDHAPPVETIAGVITAITKQVDFIDYIVMSQEIRGDKQIQHTVARIKSDCCEKPCAKAASQQKPISNFARYIPVEAKSYVVSSMIDLRMIYDTILDIVKTQIPDGDQICEKWAQAQRDIQFNVRGDLLDWVSGEFVVTAFPPAKPNPFAKEEAVALFRIRDAELARVKIPKLIERGVTFFKNSGQDLSVTPATSLPVDGFQNVTIPTMVMFVGTPCLGIWDDWFVLGTSEQAVALVMKTAAGDHPSIKKNERFIQEGLYTEEPIVGATFTNLTNIGQELSAAFFGFGFAAGMMPNEPELAPAKAILGSFVRLGPVVNKIDFLSSSSTLTTFKDNVWHSKSVTTYKSKVDPGSQ
ncbi:MAG: hypothetical protein DHS20C16_34750 [Phycisphaerae bacterium]|nr:MAG: hypothetical protein DHS20C16_34750 [Phycisphaerae bacterium]